MGLLLLVCVDACLLDVDEGFRVEDPTVVVCELILLLLFAVIELVVHQIGLGVVEALTVFGLILSLHLSLATSYGLLRRGVLMMRLARLLCRDFNRQRKRIQESYYLLVG